MSGEAPDPAPMLEVNRVSKHFGDLVAVSDVSFRLGPGVTALLGPNGAGKSTMLRMLAGMAAPSEGTVRVLGGDPRADLELRRRVGLVPQQESLFEHLRVREFVRLAADLSGTADAAEATDRAIGTVGLDPADKRRLSTYSKGMRQRAKLASAIVTGPEVLFLDEPLTGLDPNQRNLMIDLFHRIGASGRCVLVSSHVLGEVQRLGTDVLVMGQGRLLAEGDFRAIRDLMDDRPSRFRIATDSPRALAAGLIADGLAVGVEIHEPGALTVATDGAVRFAATIAPLARERGVSLQELRPLDADLESVFRYLVEGR
ncbi:MAG: ABC transporter ATP-binding protein [Acidimicrobiia bacterium]|nr:ABC transporter ATP-binding protein [Acidimicrobiia bacterium]